MITVEQVAQLDRSDSLHHKRAAFAMPKGVVYLDGNSLGALPHVSQQRVVETMQQQWGNDLIGSWNAHGWIDLPWVIGDRIGDLIGAAASQVICADSVSVNLFKALAAGLTMRPGRTVVLSAADNFPTDLYMAQGLSHLLGSSHCELRLVDEEVIADSIDDEVAIVLLSHVNFRSGRILPMQHITAAAHAASAITIWDLAHSAGALPIALDACDVDFAVGCGYKYFNGGPGAPAFIYAARHLHEAVSQPLSGWLGHRAPFAFDSHYEPAEGMAQFLCGTPPILSMASLDAALSLFDDVEIQLLREKSVALGKLFVDCVEQCELAGQLQLFSPRKAAERGSQLSWSHPHAYGLCQALIARGIVADFRTPDLLRFGFAPLYNSYEDVWQAVEALRAVMRAEEHLDDKFQERAPVT